LQGLVSSSTAQFSSTLVPHFAQLGADSHAPAVSRLSRIEIDIAMRQRSEIGHIQRIDPSSRR
jgi:hypothetical protein